MIFFDVQDNAERKSARGKKVNSVHVNTKKEIGDELEEQVLKELHDK